MPSVAKLIATVGGIGYLPKAPGTAGSAVGLLIGLFAASHGTLLTALVIWAACFVVGVATAAAVERSSGQHDPASIVVDEAVGMWAVVLGAPVVAQVPWSAGVAFVLFRAFDVIKPPPLKRLARAPGGWGIMLDDLGAAGYTVLILWCANALLSGTT